MESDLLSGSMWTILGSGVSRFLLVIGTILLANVLGVEDYGKFNIVRSTLNSVLIVAGLNLGTVITKYTSEHYTQDKSEENLASPVAQNYFFISVLTLLLSITLFGSARLLAQNVLEVDDLTDEIRLSACVLIFGILFPLNEAVYRGLQQFKRLGIFQVIGAVVFTIVVPFLGYYHGVYGAIAGLSIYMILMTIITMIDLKVLTRHLNISLFVLDRSLFSLKGLGVLTIPVLIGSFIDAPFFWAAQVMLIKFDGIEANGIASAILQLRNLVLIIPGYVGLVVLPLFSKSLSSKDNQGYATNLKNSIRLNLIFSIIMIIPLLCFPNLILGLFGDDFASNSTYMSSFLAYISIPLLVISNVYNQAFIAKNLGWLGLYVTLIWNTLLLICIYLFVYEMQMSVTGYMLSLLISIVAQLILRIYFEKRTTT